MKHPNHHIPFLVLSGVILLLVAALYVYMFNATYDSMAKALDAKELVDSEQAGQSQAKTLAIVAAQTAPLRQKLTSYFISSDTVVDFITNIESLGSQSGSKITLGSIDADPLTNAAPGATGIINARVSADGSWNSIMKLLSLVEHLPYAASVDHVQLSSLGNVVGSDGVNHYGWSIVFNIHALEMVPSDQQ